jgi:adenylate cyclase
VEDAHDGPGAPTAASISCASCATRLGPTAKFCSECGSVVAVATQSAEYKQVTVLFADVVRSMDIAAAVGAERWREIMADLVGRSAAVVERYGGTVDQFTGDGIMAVFGAPAALEDHATRACLAALNIQERAKALAADVDRRDRVTLLLRVGLNSGQVVAGGIASGRLGYTAIGDQVGMAQRMESVAAPGGVTVSASTARLIEGIATLGEAESVLIKGKPEPVTAYRMLAIGVHRGRISRPDTGFVGRQREFANLEGLLARSISGHGAVVTVVGPAGIGKSRLVREAGELARRSDVEVFSTFCESHARDVVFSAAARLLRDATGIVDLHDEAARARVRALAVDASADDLLLLYDLLDIVHPDTAPPTIDPDARRRRLSALIGSVWRSRTTPALYIVEDAHWIDDVSESLFADFLTFVPQTSSMVLITYRPDYRGLLANFTGAQSIPLGPLGDSESQALLEELLGSDPSTTAVRTLILERAAGNPFFAQEMVRELADRHVLDGDLGHYRCTIDVVEVTVPATLQATLAARIDRLSSHAKRTLNAAAVIGSRLDLDLLSSVVANADMAPLMDADLVEAVTGSSSVEYAFRHPLIREVAYESQLKSDRAELH